MIRFLLFSIISMSLALADLPPVKTYKTVNEYQSDIYFGNGILTTYEEAWIALRETLKPAILHDIYQDDKARMNKMHHFDVACNFSMKDATLPNGEAHKSGDTATLQGLALNITESSINKDHNTTLKVLAIYQNDTTKDITELVEWIVSPNDAISIEGHTLTALKDGNVTLQAEYKGRRSNPVTLDVYWEVDGHRLPPEPDPKINNATLLGVDVNHNGVRDDVERWIYEKYKDKHPIHIDIAMQAARGYRLVLEHPERAKEIHDEARKSLQCESYYRVCIRKPLIKSPVVADRSFDKILFNTKERNDAYIQYDTLLSGGSYTIPWCSERKQKCDFNTSKYEE